MRIFDILLMERDAQVLLRAATAILKLLQPQIMGCQNQEDLFNLLKAKGPLTLEKGRKIEPGLLAKTIYVDLAPLTSLAQRREKHAALLRGRPGHRVSLLDEAVPGVVPGQGAEEPAARVLPLQPCDNLRKVTVHCTRITSL